MRYFPGGGNTTETVASAGVDLYGNSQAWPYDANQIENNGSSADTASAGIRIDGNSEAFIRTGTVAHNNGPALLALGKRRIFVVHGSLGR